MTTKVLFIDDEINRPGRDAQKTRDLLHRPGEFECELRPPPRDFINLISELPDALIVDLELSTQPDEGKPVNYYGSTLAAEVRMRKPACPVILVTRPEVITGKAQLIEESVDVDLVVYKDDINRDPDGERTKIAALIEGFKALEAVSRQEWQKVLELI
jgi:hypothetical protein